MKVKVLLIVMLLLVISMGSIIYLLMQKTEEKSIDSETTLVQLTAVGGLAKKSITSDIDWIFVNEATQQVVTKKTNKISNTVLLHLYKKADNNNWTVSAKSKAYSGVTQLKKSDLQAGIFEMFLSEIQTGIDVELIAQKRAEATINIPIKWKIPKDMKAKINIQKEDEEPLFYAPPNLFTILYKDNETKLRMPSEPGKYVIRLYDTKHTKEALKEIYIEVIKAHIEIKAPDKAIAGTIMKLAWESPEDSEGQINIKEKSEKVEYFARRYIRTRGRKSVDLVLPSKEGEYAFRWYDFYSKKLVVERDIKIAKAEIELIVKDKAKAGEKVLVKWIAPKGSAATVNLQDDTGKNTKVSFAVGGKKETKIIMPEALGVYVLTWVSDGDRKEMIRREIEVIASD